MLRPLINVPATQRRALPLTYYKNVLLAHAGILVHKCRRIRFTLSNTDAAESLPNVVHLQLCFFDFNESGFGEAKQTGDARTPDIDTQALALQDDARASIPLHELPAWVTDVIRIQFILIPEHEHDVTSDHRSFGQLTDAEFTAIRDRLNYRLMLYYYTKLS